ncbi:hypothetical protein [Priestia megaterium]|uniref:hypothetical protein n=1 Tax=Priestia megaterium TaxID=1404 RepID=UPI0020D23483|nr:hypothetical protein [Priestia megaterium]MDH2362859.1 hypothetical protein [Priestia megaterium]MDH6656341.1 cellulose synthase/poly-beta-1,6-N-acetylglucosamine synthase-like glycosyltransferase [Bacillus sp. PvP124]MDP9577939.1 cellulose synthase/poly-beta-1,6-N-acetylglucosamine synthase-like glycosyltransferase [Bacillus sp. 1751]MED4063390.1 hypothetical protein [Priestia megaterium]
MNTKLIHENEKIFFILCMVISLLTYFFLIISLIGIIYLVIGFLITFILHGFSIAQIRNNGVRLTEKQFPHTYLIIRQNSYLQSWIWSCPIFILFNQAAC